MLLCQNGSFSGDTFLTPFLIGSYHEMFNCLANYDKALKVLHLKLAHMELFLILDTHLVEYGILKGDAW